MQFRGVDEPLVIEADRAWRRRPGGRGLVRSGGEGQPRIHTTTVGGEWPFNVTQEMFSAFGRLAARREKWWRGNLAADILDLLAGVVGRDGGAEGAPQGAPTIYTEK